MVNTGKPSTGCHACRARRIRCDEAKPQCMRCQKIKKPCPGYRDQVELKLGLKGRSTTRKSAPVLSQLYSSLSAQAGYGPWCELATMARKAHVDSTGNAFSTCPDSMDYGLMPTCSSETSQFSREYMSDAMIPFSGPEWHQQNSLPRQFSDPLDQQAACYFISNYVSPPSEGIPMGWLDFLMPLLRVAQPDSPLTLAFSACAFAALGSRPNSTALLHKAELENFKALKQINAALRDPEQSRDDLMIAAVFLMSVFEQLCPPGMRAQAYTSHLHGAATLIKSRGKSQFRGPIARHLGLTVRSHMIAAALAILKPIDHDTDWWMSIEAFDPKIQVLDRLNCTLAQLRVEASGIKQLVEHTADNVEIVTDLLRRAQALEQQYIEWQRSLPPSWGPKPVAWIDKVDSLEKSFVHPGRVDMYTDLTIAYTNNLCRCSRLYVWVVIICCVAWLGDYEDYRMSPEYKLASQRCKHIIADTVASVPFLLGGYQSEGGTLLSRSNDVNGGKCCGSIKGLSGSLVMLPLFTAKNSDFTSDSQFDFLKARLRYMAEEMGVHQADLAWRIESRYPSMLIPRDYGEHTDLSVWTAAKDDSEPDKHPEKQPLS